MPPTEDLGGRVCIEGNVHKSITKASEDFRFGRGNDGHGLAFLDTFGPFSIDQSVTTMHDSYRDGSPYFCSAVFSNWELIVCDQYK
jgi:hypothetical protein